MNETVYGFGKPAPQAQKIIGQVQAIDRMIDEDVPCEDIPAQINAAKSALHGCGKVVLEGHIKHCVRDGIEHGDAGREIFQHGLIFLPFAKGKYYKNVKSGNIVHLKSNYG